MDTMAQWIDMKIVECYSKSHYIVRFWVSETLMHLNIFIKYNFLALDNFIDHVVRSDLASAKFSLKYNFAKCTANQVYALIN